MALVQSVWGDTVQGGGGGGGGDRQHSNNVTSTAV